MSKHSKAKGQTFWTVWYMHTWQKTRIWWTRLYTDRTDNKQTNNLTNELTKWLTNSMEHSPSSEANSSSATDVIPHILWSLKLHSPVHRSLPSVPNMSQMNIVQALPSALIHLSVAIFQMVSFRFSQKNSVRISLLPTCPFLCPSHLPWLLSHE